LLFQLKKDNKLTKFIKANTKENSFSNNLRKDPVLGSKSNMKKNNKVIQRRLFRLISRRYNLKHNHRKFFKLK